MSDPRAPKEIDRADILAELTARFEEGGGGANNAIAWVLDELTELDILAFRQPVDDPSKDPIGTVRGPQGEPCVKVRNNCWVVCSETIDEPIPLKNKHVAELRIIGAVPGTPAAEHDPLNFIRQIQAIQRTPGESDEQYRKRMIRDGHAHVGDKNAVHPGGFDDCRDCRPERSIREVLPS